MQIRNDKGIVKWLLIGLCTVFLLVTLVLPLVYVIYTALREGFQAYLASVTDTYAVKAILLTVKVVIITGNQLCFWNICSVADHPFSVSWKKDYFHTD